MGLVLVETAVRQPDIEYQPDFKKYQARTKARLHTEPLDQSSLPPGFPQRLESDLVWEGESLANQYDWTYVLTEAEIEELEEALTYFKCQQSLPFLLHNLL